MIPRKIAARAMVAAASAFLTAPALAACELASGAKTAALVELYTSEGCSSCPPADRQMSRLQEALDSGAVAVPLALHVGYWDYIGWKDRYAQPAFAERQERLVQANGQRTLYTPQFFVNGAELRARRTTLREEVRRLNALPASASIHLQAAFAAQKHLRLSATADAPSHPETASLYVVVSESRLESKVSRGENAGATLQHDHVVRLWLGPARLAGGRVSVTREVELPAAWQRSHLELAAFVQDEQSGRVLQALGGRCSAGS